MRFLQLREKWIQYIYFVVLSFVVCMPAFIHEGELLGAEGAEVFGHAWTHWWRAEELPNWPTGTDLAVNTAKWPVIDPLPILISSVMGFLGGPAFGYNFWICCSVFFAAWGGWVLAEKVGGTPWVGSLVLAWTPPFIGSLRSGLTEDGAIGLVALGLAFLHERWWLAGLCIGISAWCGLVIGWFGGIAAIVVGIFIIKQDPAGWKKILGAGGIAFFLALGAGWFHLTRLSQQGKRFGQVQMEYEPNWVLNPVHHCDLASLFYPGQVDLEGLLIRTHPGYIGLSIIVLAIFAVRWRWLVVSLVMILLALGETIWFMGSSTGIANPVATLFTFLPGGDSINHSARALLVASVAISALASLGCRRICERFSISKWLLLVIVGLDLLLLSPISITLPVTTPSAKILHDLQDLSPGSALVLPAGGPGISFQQPLWEQRLHGRSLLLDPNQPGIPKEYTKGEWMKWLNGLAYHQDNFVGQVSFAPQIAILIVKKEYSDRLVDVLGLPDKNDEVYFIWDILHRSKK